MNKKDLTINVKGELIDFAVPKVMAIVNITPDSFYAGSRVKGLEEVISVCQNALENGADMIDMGGCSTRPGASDISEQEEWARIKPALEAFREALPDVILSLDTWRAGIASRAVEDYGVNIINDVSGGREPEIWDVAAENHVAYVLTHTRGVPGDMTNYTDYTDVTANVITELSWKVNEIRLHKVNDIIIDPGFGFAKTPVQSLRLLDNLQELVKTGMPLLAGLSRKSMIWRALGITPEESYEGTVALDAIAIDRGADILRVHDVKAAKQTVELLARMKGL